jgi:hypothetical protein
MPVTRAAIGMLLPRSFAGVLYMQEDMSTEFYSCRDFPNCHWALFIMAVVYLSMVCVIAPLVFYQQLRVARQGLSISSNTVRVVQRLVV